jgi:hypothetical protein
VGWRFQTIRQLCCTFELRRWASPRQPFRHYITFTNLLAINNANRLALLPSLVEIYGGDHWWQLDRMSALRLGLTFVANPGHTAASYARSAIWCSSTHSLFRKQSKRFIFWPQSIGAILQHVEPSDKRADATIEHSNFFANTSNLAMVSHCGTLATCPIITAGHWWAIKDRSQPLTSLWGLWLPFLQ